jgi:hypothetical protein
LRQDSLRFFLNRYYERNKGKKQGQRMNGAKDEGTKNGTGKGL